MEKSAKIAVRIKLKKPDDAEAKIAYYEVPYQKDMRIIDVLNWLNDTGKAISFRWFCSSKKCGACAVTVNGIPRLTCWEAAEPGMLIGPLENYEVVRDLVVDRESYQQRLLGLKPYVSRTHTPNFPEPLKHADIYGSFRLMDCIECGICTSGCPAYSGVIGPFPGPWTLVQIAKFARDPRDEMTRDEMLESSGVNYCMSCYRCEELCPVGIPIVSEAIEPLRGMAARGNGKKASFPLSFAQNVRDHVYVHSASLYLKSHGIGELIMSLPLVFRMFIRGKTKFRTRIDKKAQRQIDALFRAAADKEMT